MPESLGYGDFQWAVPRNTGGSWSVHLPWCPVAAQGRPAMVQQGLNQQKKANELNEPTQTSRVVVTMDKLRQTCPYTCQEADNALWLWWLQERYGLQLAWCLQFKTCFLSCADRFCLSCSSCCSGIFIQRMLIRLAILHTKHLWLYTCIRHVES